jgi:hypothetical protein
MKKIIILLFTFIATLAYAESLPVIPEGFEKQTLDVTYGHIAKPKDWFYTWFTTQNGIVWTISKENLSKQGSYLTGMRIQFVFAVSKQLKKTPQEFAEGFIDQKKKASTVLNECQPKTMEDFTRSCIETKEKIVTAKGEMEFHTLYSVLWSKAKDYFVITTFGAPVEDWEKVKPIVDVMADFVLIGDEFWEKIGTPNKIIQPDRE